MVFFLTASQNGGCNVCPSKEQFKFILGIVNNVHCKLYILSPFFMPSHASISGGLSSFKKFSPLTRNVKPPMTVLSVSLVYYQNKTISDEGITVDFWIIKAHTSNSSSNSWGSSNSWQSSNSWGSSNSSLKSVLSFEMIIKFFQAHKTHRSILKTSWKNLWSIEGILRTSENSWEHLKTSLEHLKRFDIILRKNVRTGGGYA